MSTQRKYFGTDGIRGRVGEFPINPEFILKLGWAVGRVLARGNSGKVLIGKDTRISGYMFESALEAGLSAAGVNIHLLGPMPTPAIAYLTRTLRADVGIVISASHNPYMDNGIKFFSHRGSKLPDDIELAIEEQLDQPISTVESSKLGKAHRVVDAPGRYIEFCKSTVPSNTSLRGLKIIIDCANGATYHVAPAVFTELGADVIAIHRHPNGININQDCGATSIGSLRETVLKEKADLGIALDGDGDRCIMVDNKGEILDGDDILFILSRDWAAEGKLQGGVVGTVMSNFALELALQKNNIPFVRTQVGDRYILEALYQQNWILGGEPSGHLVCLNATTTGDGIVSALQVLAIQAKAEKSLSELKSGLTKFPQKLINVKVAEANQIMQQVKLQEAIKMAEQSLNGQGRVLLRPSGTEPLLRVMVEGRDDKQVNEVAEQLAQVVKECAVS